VSIPIVPVTSTLAANSRQAIDESAKHINAIVTRYWNTLGDGIMNKIMITEKIARRITTLESEKIHFEGIELVSFIADIHNY
jgi:hypothetical protein